MRFTKSPLLFGVAAMVALLVAGCGASSNNAGAGPTSTATTVPAATATTAPAASGAVVQTASVSVSGTMETVLVTSTGLTLYYHTPDTTTSVFTNTASWPPLLSAGGAPTTTATLSGKLDILNDANGAQVTYNGHPLYTFAGDSAAGQANGQGLGNVWYVVAPSLATGASATPSGTATPCVGYYCR